MRASPVSPFVVALATALGGGLVVHGYLTPSPATCAAGAVLLGLALGPLALAARGRMSEGLVALSLASCLLTVALFGAEIVLRRLSVGAPEARPEPVYSYDEARGDPDAFQRWWLHYLGEWLRSRRGFVRADPAGVLPGVFIPGARVRFFDSTFRINALGFRGDEISREKGGRFRIVALGTSTTFGATLAASDEPWPLKLEDRIRRDLDCDAPVEVINAGGVGYRLHHNLARLDRDILPLDPDLIVSFHNHNGFRMVRALQIVDGGAGEEVPERGSILLARAERLLRRAFDRRNLLARRRAIAEVEIDEAFESGLLDTALAQDYRALVDWTREQGIALVLCTHPLAVDATSPAEVVAFYESGFPDVHTSIVLNELHSRLVEETGRRHGVPVIDVRPGLDGAWRDAYIDLFHYTEPGREQVADAVFEGLVPLLAAEPRARCTPRVAAGRERERSQ